jgi:hypothetical protein
VRFAARALEPEMAACHCRMCQRWGGTCFISAMAPADAVTWTGAEHVTTYPSSDWAERGFCARCGSHLFYRAKRSGAWEIPVGLFDADPGVKLAFEIYADRASPAYALAGDRPRLTEAESIARYTGDGG